MGIRLGIGNIDLRNVRPFSWSAWWASQPEVLFFGEISKITGGRLYNQKSGATDYLTIGGSAGSYTFQCPNTAAYIAADTDYLWFTDGAIQRVVTTDDLINFDFVRSIIYYDDEAPYTIQAIMIISSDIAEEKKNKLYKNFRLSLYWSGVYDGRGYLKGNKGLHYVPWDGYNSDELLKTNLTYNFVANIYSKWIVSGANTREQDGNAVKVTYVNNTTGASVALRKTITDSLLENLSIGDQIKVIVKTKAVGTVKVRIGDGSGYGQELVIIGTSELTEQTLYRTLSNSVGYIRVESMGAGEVAWVEFISVKKKI